MIHGLPSRSTFGIGNNNPDVLNADSKFGLFAHLVSFWLKRYMSERRRRINHSCDCRSYASIVCAAGVPVHADRAQAWRDFVGWRVNYDQVLHALAALVDAPYTPWVSDRSPARPARRYRLGRRRVAIARGRMAPL